MRVWGLICQIDRGEATVFGVVAEGSVDSPTLRPVLGHATARSDDWPQKLRLLASDLDTELGKATPDHVLVETMGWTSAQQRDAAALSG